MEARRKLGKLAFIGSGAIPGVIALATAISILGLQTARLSELDSKNLQKIPKLEYINQAKQLQQSLNTINKLPKSKFDNLIANWSFLSFLQYFGDDTARENIGYGITADFFEVIVNRDPLFISIYPYLSAGVTLFAGEPQKTVSLIEKGAKAIPEPLKPGAYFLWQSKGTDELLFLGRNDAAQKSYLNAAGWAGLSADPVLQTVAKRSAQTASFLASNPNSRRARASSWANILTSAIDDGTRRRAVAEIRALGGNVAIDVQGQLRISLPLQD
jgi:hypothetical protein